jgi:mannonate dehydratase
MRVAMAIVPNTTANLRTAKQIGVDHVVYYDMQTMPLTFDALAAEARRLDDVGLKLTVVECGPPIDAIVRGSVGRDRQIEQFKRSLGHMGRLGVEVLCYTFMPPVLPDAMVVRTSYATPARGGAPTTAYRAAAVTRATVPHDWPTIPEAALWDHLDYFLRAIVPAAEAAGVKLAMHPDDPPQSPICGLNRIMSSVDAFDRLLSLSSSPVNGITFCQGCFLEMGADLVEVVRRYAPRLHYAHFRDVAGTPTDFVETFPDDGPTDFPAVFRALRDANCASPIRVDHVPRLAVEAGDNDGYGFAGHLYATGYLKGLLEPIFGKPSLAQWRAVPPAERAARYSAGSPAPPAP